MMRGFTLIELLVVMSILAILLAIMGPNLRALNDPLDDAAQQVAAVIKQSRMKAMSNTMAVKVYPASTTALKVESATSCAATTWSAETAFDKTLPGGIVFTATNWRVCFDGRGLATSSTPVTSIDTSVKVDLLRQKDGMQRHIEVLLGGGVVGP